MNQIKAVVETQNERMFAAERTIWQNPETGYREWKTHAFMKAQFEEMGYQVVEAGNIPGFYADLDSGREGPTVALMAEMDSVLCVTHPECDSQTGAVHACGHHAQCAAILGVAWALRQEEILSQMSGKIRFLIVPAEELLEIEYREGLKQQGIIHYFGGKVEFMYRGYFDDVDVAVMLHSGGGNNCFYINRGMNGCLVKKIEYEGKAAHAGGQPDAGVNALYAANLGLSAINALRETFRDYEHIRVHPIMTYGGAAVNVIPDRAIMESYVRGKTMESYIENNRKVNRALAASAAAMGAKLHLTDRPGYSPVDNDVNLNALAIEVMKQIVPEENVHDHGAWGTGCTDMGDISCVIPAIHPSGSGMKGTGHGADYYLDDAECACTQAAQFLAGIGAALLVNDAEKAKYIKANAKLKFGSIKEYFDMINQIELDDQVVEYNEDGSVTLRYQK